MREYGRTKFISIDPVFSAAVGSQLTTEFALLRQTDAVLMRCYVIQEHRSTARSSVRPHSSLVCLFVLLSCCPFVLLPRKFCPIVFFANSSNGLEFLVSASIQDTPWHTVQNSESNWCIHRHSHTHLQRLINIASPFSPSNNKFTTNLLKQDESESIILPPKHPQILTGNSQSVPVFFFFFVASILRSFVHSRIRGSGCGVLRICLRGCAEWDCWRF